jgi:hypothetical protein
LGLKKTNFLKKVKFKNFLPVLRSFIRSGGRGLNSQTQTLKNPIASAITHHAIRISYNDLIKPKPLEYNTYTVVIISVLE